MAVREYRIREFQGIDQSAFENGLDPAYSPDACNMDTSDGALKVARGYVRHIPSPVPGTGAIRRLYLWRSLVTTRCVVVAGNAVYAWRDTDETPAWETVYTYPDTVTGLRISFCEAKIGSTDVLLIACGEHPIVKWDGTNPAAAFGSAAGLSDKHVNYLAMHYSRLFCAGDPEYPSRLYWSKAPGDGRSIEDWTADDASENTGGGHVEVGDTSGDPITGLVAMSNQLLIFKRSSIYRLLGDRPGNYRVYRVSAETERCAHTACMKSGDMPCWLTKAGIFYYDGQNAQRLFNARNIQGFLAGARVTATKAAKNRDLLYFTAYEGSESATACDNAMVVYDTLRRTYMIRRGFTAADICAADGTLYLIGEGRYVCRFDEGDDYDGAPIEAYWDTPLTDLDGKPQIKLLMEMYFRGRGLTVSGEGAVVCVEAQAGRNRNHYRYLMPERIEDVLEIPLKSEGRTFRFRFSNEAGSRFEIQGGVQVLFQQRLRAL